MFCKEYITFIIFYLFIPLLFPSCSTTPDSQRIACIKSISYRVNSIELSNDISDLEFLKNILTKDSVQIILLGEQSHGDGTTFIAKSKMVKFLHEEMGFDVLAFESGFYDCYKGWQLIQKEKDYNWGLIYSIFGFWTFSNEMQPLIKYLQSTLNSQNPMILAGFDNQLTGQGSSENLFLEFKNLNLFIEDNTEVENFKNIINFLAYNNVDKNKEKMDSSLYSANINLLNKLITRLDGLIGSTDTNITYEFWKLVIKGIKVQYNFIYNQQGAEEEFSGQQITNERDFQMAENLLWMMNNVFKNKKIIVWAANFHIMRNFSEIQFRDPMNVIASKTSTMGDYVWNVLKKKMYAVTFTDYENYMYGNNSASSGDTSIEYCLEKAGFNYAFVDLRDSVKTSCLNRYFKCKLLGHQEQYGYWNNVTDGIFFIDDIKRSKIGRQ